MELTLILGRWESFWEKFKYDEQYYKGYFSHISKSLGILLWNLPHKEQNYVKREFFSFTKNGGLLKRGVFILDLAILCQRNLSSNIIRFQKSAMQEITY